jgi:lysophospholipase L1-like esterase
MKRSLHLTLRATQAVALFSIVFSATSVRAQVDFTRYVALGDSLTAGFQSGSLNQTYQATSYPALIARQGGATGFQQPLVTEPGIPAILELRSLSPLQIVPKGGIGQPANLTLPRPYNNMAVPGADVVDLTTTTTDNGGLHDLILRRTGFTQLQQGLSLAPTVVTLWIGNNDVLGAATSGRVIEDVTITSVATFEANYRAAATAIGSITGVKVAVANIPNVTSIPFVTTVPRVVVNPATNSPVLIGGQPVPLIGPDGPLASGDFVLLTATAELAQGKGIPVALGGSGLPLSDSSVLSAAEVQTIVDRTNAFNTIISTVASEKSWAFVNASQAVREFSNGVSIGGINFSSAFLTGGLFSYDGVHASSIGYAIVANLFIDALNSKYGSTIPTVDLASFFFQNGQRRRASESSDLETPSFVFTKEAAASLRKALGVPTDLQINQVIKKPRRPGRGPRH